MAPRDLYDLCAEWLALCEAAVASTIGGAIEHSYVSAGPPAFDCVPQLTVHAGAPSVADTAPLSPPLAPGHRERQGGAVNLIAMTATVIRCAATSGDDGEPPDLADLESAGRATSEDVWAIWAWTRTRNREGTLFASPSGTREMFLDPAFPVPASGNAVGWQIPIRVALAGYSPAS